MGGDPGAEMVETVLLIASVAMVVLLGLRRSRLSAAEETALGVSILLMLLAKTFLKDGAITLAAVVLLAVTAGLVLLRSTRSVDR